MTIYMIWIYIALIMFILEAFTFNYGTIFFGITAIIMSMISYIFNININIQITIFLLLSIIMFILLRNILIKKFNMNETNNDQTTILLNEFTNKIAIVTEAITQTTGKVEFKGAIWNAISTKIIKKNMKVLIIKRDNLTLYVK